MIAQHMFMQSTARLCEASSTFQMHGDCLCLKAVGDTLPSDQAEVLTPGVLTLSVPGPRSLDRLMTQDLSDIWTTLLLPFLQFLEFVGHVLL